MNSKRFSDQTVASDPSLSRRSWLTLGLGAATAVLMPRALGAAAGSRRVVVWAEGTAPEDKVYPQDVNTAMADGLRKYLKGWKVDTAGLSDPEQGCSEASLKSCDVLIWWGHKRHGDVKSEHVDRVVRRVKEEGMGFISVHSSHFARPNRKLMGTACSWGAYECDGCKLNVKVKLADHPIGKGVKDFTLPQIERYSEPYAVPEPEAVPIEGTYVYPNGKEEKVRVGLCWTVGKGRMFYFLPGHETYRDLYFDEVHRILSNAVEWAAPRV